MTDAERIAVSLTEAQRQCIIEHRPYRGDPDDGWPESAFDPKSWNVAGRALKKLGLVTWADSRGSHTRLTPLGQEVRRQLEGRESEG